MKHLPVILLIAVALMGCTQTSVQPVSLTAKPDSVNYALGYIHGSMSYTSIANDSTGQALKVFMCAFDRVADGAMKDYSSAYRAGYQLGLGVIDFETAGLSHNPLWPLNEELLLQGFIAGYNTDTTILTPQGMMHARNRANSIQTKAWITVYDQVFIKRCPQAGSPVVMENKVDTMNYAFGWSNGFSFAQSTSQDSTFIFDDCIAGINKALRQHPDYPAAIIAAQHLAFSTDSWQQKGLNGKNFPYKSATYRQALVNGLNKDTTVMTFYQAATYLNQTLPECLPPSIKRRL